MQSVKKIGILVLALGLWAPAVACDDDGGQSQLCGDGVIEGSEQCDQGALGGAECTTIPGGFTGGNLTCASDCTFDTSGCTTGSCGDSNVDPTEDCDGANLDGNDCTTVGNFSGGTLACATDCTFDTAACDPPVGCGDGAVGANEDCDGLDLDGNDCTTVPGAFTAGTLACDGSCAFDTSGCTGGGTSAQIAAARAEPDGGGLSLPIQGAWVTYIKPAVGSDASGFFVQADPTGPALFVASDPSTLTVGDDVDFTVTDMGTSGGLRQAIGITGLVINGSGNDVTTLTQDVNGASDLQPPDPYESELMTVDATIVSSFGFAGTGHLAADIDTPTISGNADLELRLPDTLVDTLDLVTGCMVSVNDTPMWRFNARAQFSAYNASEVSVNSCPAPQVTGAVAIAPTTVVVSFDRFIDPTSITNPATQFTFDNGLVASAAFVSGRDVTVTTGAQVGGTTYTVTVLSTVTDTLGSGVDPLANQASFLGFTTPATVVINELVGNITSGCDLIELRVVSGGSMDGYEVFERTGSIVTFSGLVVNTNDFIVIHFNTNSATCNSSGATDETGSPIDFPNLTNPANFDTAYDWWTTDTGMTGTDNVITLVDNTGTIMDAVFVSDDPAGTAAAATETQAATVAAAGQWEMVGGGIPAGGFVDDDFNMHAAQDLNGTATDGSESIQRTSNADSNTVADWTQAASSWGLINPGQVPF